MTIQEYNDIYKNTVIKKMTIATSGGLVIRNSNIASENMSLEESLCSEQNLKFGCCEASCFKIRLLECNHSFLGEWLDVSQTIYTDEDGFLLLENGGYLLTEDGFRIQLETADAFSKYGRFKVYSDKPTNDRMWRDLVCYDAMYDILNADMLPWYKTLTFPMTLKALRDSFFTYLDIPQQTTTLVNDSFQTEGGFLVDGQLSGKTIINAICELNGVFGHISHDGVFEYISLPSADTIALDWYYDGTGAYEGYVVDNITGVRAIGSDADAGTSVGTTNNVYIVNNNPLIYGTEGTPALETALTNLLDVIKDITYRPFNVTTYGNPMLPLGTNLVISTRDQTINSFVMQRTLKGIQALKDTYKAVGDENQPTDVNSLQSQIIRSRGKTHEMEVDVNQLKSTINDPETGVVSVLEQTVSQIVMKVDDNGNIVQVQLGKDPDDPSATAFKVSADNIDFIANGVMNLTANAIGINATNFSIDKDTGNITCNGGTIGGWEINSTSISKSVPYGVSTVYTTRLISNEAEIHSETKYDDPWNTGQYVIEKARLKSGRFAITNTRGSNTDKEVVDIGCYAGSTNASGFVELHDTDYLTQGATQPSCAVSNRGLAVYLPDQTDPSTYYETISMTNTGLHLEYLGVFDRVLLVSDDSLHTVVASNITATELNCLDNVSSNIQTQLNGKVSKSGDTMTGQLKISGSASSQPLTVRAIVGCKSDLSALEPLFLQFGNSVDDSVYFGNSGGGRIYSNGTKYTGNAATASDASKLNGYASDTAASKNTIARRDANGYLRAVFYNQSSSTENIGSYSGALIAFFSTDGWLRKTSIANAGVALRKSVLTWTYLMDKNANGTYTVSSMANFEDICIIFGYVNQTQATINIPRSRFATGAGIVIKDPVNSQQCEVYYVSATQIKLANLSNSNWHVVVYGR